MKALVIIFLAICLPFIGMTQTVTASKITKVILPLDFRKISSAAFPDMPSKDDFPAHSKRYAKGEYFEYKGAIVQIYGVEQGLPLENMTGMISMAKAMQGKSSKTYRVADLRTINNLRIFRLANEGNPNWGSLMITVFNSATPKESI